MLKFDTIFDLLNSGASEQDFINYLEEVIGNGKPVCPFCSDTEVYKSKTRKNTYICSKTKKYFNIKAGFSFENSRISLKKGFYALHALFNWENGVSSYRLAKEIGVSQRTAGYMLDRLRTSNKFFLFKNKVKLKGVVEGDETYLGGENENRHWDKKVPNSQGRSGKDKIPVFVMVERGGNAIAEVVPNVKKKTLEPIIRANVEEGSTVNTDEGLAYKDLEKGYTHLIVNHRKKQYAKGEASVNTAESFNNRLKGRIYGTYRWISRTHAQKYVSETVMRWNTRKYSDKERFNLVLNSMAIGKGLPMRF